MILGFSKTETLAYALIILILNIATLYVKWQSKYFEDPPGVSDYQLRITDSLRSVLRKASMSKTKPAQMVDFNPNTVSGDSLKKWGVPHHVVSNLSKYRQAGGTFRSKEDLKKIYGMNDSVWQVLLPFLVIPKPDPRSRPEPQPRRSCIDINLADSVELQVIPGIGPVLSARIVKYRRILGGFYTKDQLEEVYGLSPQVLEKLKQWVCINPHFDYHKLSINSLDYGELARHPYVSYPQARAIVAYREMHGDYESLEKLKAVHLVDDSTYIKVYPYLDF